MIVRLRGLIALVATLAVVCAVPWALWRFGGSPWRDFPSLRSLGDIGDVVVSDSMVFAVLTIAAWTVWALFVASLGIELVAAVRGATAPNISLFGPVQRVARSLVAAIVIAATLHQGTPAAATSTPGGPLPTRHAAAVVVVHEEPAGVRKASSARTTDTVRPAPHAADADRTIAVTRGDSAWSLAERHLGDGMRWRELWDLNRDRVQPDGHQWTDPDKIAVGWLLLLPPEGGGSDASLSPVADPATSLTASSTIHVVEPGDTLSAIAHRYLGSADRFPEIAQLNEGVAQPDGRSLTDPNLILPGWQLSIPDDDAPSLIDEPPAHHPVPAPDSSTLEAAEDTTRAGDDQAPSESTVPDEAPTLEDVVATTPTAQPGDPAGAPAVDNEAEHNKPERESGLDPSDDATSDGTGALPLLVGLAGAVALSSGLLLRIRRREALRRTRGARPHRQMDPERRETALAVSAAADVPLVQWATHHLTLALRSLRPDQLHAAPIAVEISEDAGLEILWTAPQPGAPRPWTIADGGWAWRLTYDPDVAIPSDGLPASIPALVTIGRRDGRQLLVDLEAFGTLTVDGDDGAADDFLRSVAVELTGGQDLADAHVLTHGIDNDFEHLERLHPSEFDDIVSAVRAQRVGVEGDDKGFGTFAERLRSPAPIDTTVVVGTFDDDQRSRLVAECPTRSGVALVTWGEPTGDTAAHIQIVEPGRAVLKPLGLAFDPVALPIETTTSLADLVRAIDEEPDPAQSSSSTPSTAVDEFDPSDTASTNGSTPHPTTTSDPTSLNGHVVTHPDLFTDTDSSGEPEMLVHVLGAPSVPDRPDLGRRDLNLTVFLACRAGPVAASAVQDALWGGKPVEPKTVWNVVGSARRSLGTLPDGTPVIPATDRTHGTLRVSDGVTTDLAMLRDLVDRAADEPTSIAIELLREGLGLITGPPFDAPGYDWAHRDQDVAEASALIEHATLRLVELAREAGDTDLAREALLRGLRGLPGNEELYRSRMRVEHDAGNTAGVKRAYDELVTYLADFESEPSASTTALLRLLAGASRR